MPRPVSNPPLRYRSMQLDYDGEAPAADLQVFEDASRSILAENDSPDVPFRFSVNPYRGCAHACAYCYARPSHQHLDLGAGTDFERKLVVKPAAAALLRAALLRPSWRGEPIAFSGNTDCYQPLEARLGLTRACLEVCRELRNPVGVITKSTIVERDAALLAELAATAHATVTLSIAFSDEAMARALEPGAPGPGRRVRTIAALAAAGVPVGVSLSPIIPGLNDEQGVAILESARAAGARFFSYTPVRLAGEVRPVFTERLRAAFPGRADAVLAKIREARSGQSDDTRFFVRMRGVGPRFAATAALLETTARRLGYEPWPPAPDPSPFRRPSGQLDLFPGLDPGTMSR